MFTGKDDEKSGGGRSFLEGAWDGEIQAYSKNAGT